MGITRRRFLRASGQALAQLGLGATWVRLGAVSALAQAGPGYRALVCVFLDGGNDSNNMLVPLDAAGYQAYSAARSVLALPRAALLPVATPDGTTLGLHPRLSGLQRLFDQRAMAVVANVGLLVRPITREEYLQRSAPIPVNLYSHLDQHRQWQSAGPTGDTSTGWGGRISDRIAASNPAVPFPPAVSVAGSPLFAAGRNTSPATLLPLVPIGLAGVNDSADAVARLESFEELLRLDSGAVLVQAANAITTRGLRESTLLKSALAARPPLTTPFPASPLGLQLREIADVIHARGRLGADRQIFFCTLAGFDTHVGQLGEHDRLLTQLGQALSAFYDATVEMGVERSVTTFTASEFGRTLQPTSAGGSDHGWGNHHVVIGGSVRGGNVYGQLPTLALGGPDDAGSRGVWIPTTSLDTYAATLAGWFGMGEADLPLIFPHLANFPTANLGFLS